MKKHEALAIVGGLSTPGKMPCHGYGLPAAECHTGSKLAEIKGTICNNCYALKGQYRFKNVQDAQYRRLASIINPRWSDAMTTLIKGMPFFRWHDSGDLQSITHFGKICMVAEHTPETLHWLPTRESLMVKTYEQHGGFIPDNLIIRFSATKVDGPPPTGWPLTSTVHSPGNHKYGYECPASKQGNKCMDCRACWSKHIPNISYKDH